MKITDFINGPVTYESEGQYFWITGKSNGIQLLAELRGWGHIQNMFVKNGKMDIKTAEEYQDQIGQFVADAINEKIENDKKVALGNSHVKAGRVTFGQ